MTVSFELPDYCHGCMNMSIEHSTNRFYADGREEPIMVDHRFHCTHAEQCDHLIKYLFSRFDGSKK